MQFSHQNKTSVWISDVILELWNLKTSILDYFIFSWIPPTYSKLSLAPRGVLDMEVDRDLDIDFELIQEKLKNI